MKTSILILCASVMVLTGCKSPVPGNHISGSLGGVPFKIENPKQFSAKGFQLTLDAGTNHFVLHFDEMSSQNDPQVIDKSYAGQAAVAKQFFSGINDLMGKIVEGGISGAKK